MAPLMILQSDEAPRESFLTRRARLRERLAARIWRTRLDGELARGVPPEAHAALSLRAQLLGEPRTRRDLARAITRVLDDAQRETRRGLWSARVEIQRKDIQLAADELDEIAVRLLAPGPVCARGLARIRLLLSDAVGSPLYRANASTTLRDALTRALEELEPAFPW